MRRLFLGVFGGFCATIILISIFNTWHFSAIHRLQEALLKTDHVAQRLLDHKEQFQAFGRHHPLFDSVARRPEIWAAQSRGFWNSLRNETLELAEADGIVISESGKRELNKAMRFMGNRELRILEKVAAIGFKDAGNIGEMRRVAHEVEANYPASAIRLLSLRRHEKDFLMRLDPRYREDLNNELAQWKQEAEIPRQILMYGNYFKSLSTDYVHLLHPSPSGLYYNWNRQMERLQLVVRQQRSQLVDASFRASSKATLINYLLDGCAVVLAIVCTLIFTRRFSRQVKQLQRTMEQYIAANYSYESTVQLQMPRNEFGLIIHHFIQLTRKIRSDMQLLEDRVQRRTKALHSKNQQLELQHREIMDSLRYAQDLQQSLLVSRSRLLATFQEAWIYYQPKNLVGGDFFWMREITTDHQTISYFALADCTGHGVPGALLSVMGMNTLDELIQKGLTRPETLLNELRTTVSRRLNAHADKRYDGMDIALFSLNRHTMELRFAGAQMPVWLIRDNELTELQGQRMPVGYTLFDVAPFLDQVISIQPGDKLILFSDGIIDQFGGLRAKKMGRKALRELLGDAGSKPSSLLFSDLVQYFEHWKGKEEQTDDCTFILLEPSGVLTEKGETASEQELLSVS